MYNSCKGIRNMSEITDLSSIMQNQLLLFNINTSKATNNLQDVKNQLSNLPSILDKQTLTDLKNGKYEISLKEYTSFNTYSTMMEALYGNNSANSFQNSLNILTDSAETKLANAKSFIDKMKENGMSNKSALKTYTALQKYSLVSSAFTNYNFVNAKA